MEAIFALVFRIFTARACYRPAVRNSPVGSEPTAAGGG